MNRVNNRPASHGQRAAGRVSTAVITAVADAVDENPTELQTCLYDSIDPDALDDLFQDKYDGTPRTGGHVAFTMYGYEVTVYSDGGIRIFDLHEEQEDRTPILTSWKGTRSPSGRTQVADY